MAAARSHETDPIYWTYDDDYVPEGEDALERARKQAAEAELARKTTFRRATVLATLLLTFAWFAFTIVFQFEVLDEQSPLDNSSLTFYDPARTQKIMTDTAIAFTSTIGALFALAIVFYLASRRMLFVRDAQHVGAIWNFIAVSLYAYGTVMGIGWALVSVDALLVSAVEIIRRRQNWYDYAFYVSLLGSFVSITATSSVSGMLAGVTRGRAVEIARRKRARRRRSRRQPPQQKQLPSPAAYVPSSMRPKFNTKQHRRVLYHSFRATLPRDMRQQQPSPVAASVPEKRRKGNYDYVFSPHRTLPFWSVLSVVSSVLALFLVIMSFLALLQSQMIRAITNLWAYTLVYAIGGMVLVGVHLSTLLSYERAHPELTIRHMWPLNLFALVSFIVWAFTTFMLSSWLRLHAPGTCCSAATAAVVPGVEPAWTLYNSDLTLTAALGLLVICFFVPVISTHVYPERRTEVERTPHGGYVSDDDDDDDSDSDDEKGL